MPPANNRRFAAGLGAQTKRSRGTVKSEISEYDSEDEDGDEDSEEDYDSEEEGEESNEEESSYAMTTDAKKKSPK